MKRVFTILILAKLLFAAGLRAQGVLIQGRTFSTGATINKQAPPFPDPLVITTVTLPDGTEQATYSENLTSTGGTSPYEWILSAGSDPLPPGLTLSSAGLISGTPTASGTYPFTVRVTDNQPVFKTALLSITIDAIAPPPSFLITENAEDGNLTANPTWTSAGQCDTTQNGFIDGNWEIRKFGATDCIFFDNEDLTEAYCAVDLHRFSTGAPATDRDSAIIGLGSGGETLFQIAVKTGWDVYAKAPGQAGNGFLVGNWPADTNKRIAWHYKPGSGSDGLFEVRLNGGNAQSFAAATPAVNLDRVILRDNNNHGSQLFYFDRLTCNNTGWETYTPPVPAPPASGNCFNESCVTTTAVPTGSGLLLTHSCASEGNDRNPTSATSSVDGALTLVGSHDANGVRTTLWAKLGATPGNHTITVVFPGGSDEVEAACQSDTRAGVTSGTAEATATGSQASSSTISTNITTVSTDAALVSIVGGSSQGSVTPGAGQVEFFDSPGGNTPAPGMFGAGSTKVSTGAAGSKTMSYTASGTMALTHFVAAFPTTTPPPQNGTLLSQYCTSNMCDGSTDNRACIQNALNNRASWVNNTLIFPAAQTCIIGSQLTMTSKNGWTILGQGSTIKAKNGMCLDSNSTPGCTGSGPMFYLADVDNFTIDNLDMDGNRANRQPFQQFGGHNYVFDHATNGTIRNVDSINSPTDNAIVKGTNKASLATRSANLTFIDSKFHNAWRNNVSVTYAVNTRFLGQCSGTFSGTCTCAFTSANGIDPEAGLDWEPDGNESSPAIEGGLVDGCQFSGNYENGMTTEGKAGARNITVRNSRFWGNGLSTPSAGPHRAALRFTAINDLAENNYFGTAAGVNWGLIYIQAGVNALVQNNFIDGQPPIGALSGSRKIMYFGNFGNGSGQFKNNTITNSGFNFNSTGWCRIGVAGGSGSSVSGNTFGGTTQAPNPGCP